MRLRSNPKETTRQLSCKHGGGYEVVKKIMEKPAEDAEKMKVAAAPGNDKSPPSVVG